MNSIKQLQILRCAALERGDHNVVTLCDHALSATDSERERLATYLQAREDLRRDHSIRCKPPDDFTDESNGGGLHN